MWLLLVCVIYLSQSCYGKSHSSSQATRIELLLSNIKSSQNRITMELTQIKETLQKQNAFMEQNLYYMERVLNGILTIANNTSHESKIQNHDGYDIKDCKSANRSGLHKLMCESCQTATTVYCEMDKFDGGWLVMQQRLDGSVEFRRNWTEYRNGFGTVDKSTEFWLGLELIHLITNSGSYELSIELRDHNGKHGYARYSDFKIAGESDAYRLSNVGQYNGTIGERLGVLRGSQFSTFDRDNEMKDANCVDTYFSGGGWWSRGCFIINLNGAYIQNQPGYGISWYSFSNAATFSRMMIRRKSILY